MIRVFQVGLASFALAFLFMFKLSKTSIKRLEGVNPVLIEIIEDALRITKIDFGIPEYGGLRTATEQRKLFIDGKSQLDGVEKLSYHQTGNAFDVFAFVNGRASWDENHLSQVAAAILQAAAKKGVALEWGGLWRSFVDMPHFELRK